MNNSKSLRALVTDPHVRYGLAVIRSLGRRGIHVTCLYDRRDFLRHGLIFGALSKYCKKLLITDDIVSDIIKLSCENDVLIPISTPTIDKVAKNLDLIKNHIKTPISDFDTIYKTRNKELLIRHCMENGITVPNTYFLQDLSQLNEVAGKVTYPSVIKFRDENVDCYPRYIIVNSQEELISNYLERHKMQDFPLIQEYIRGKGVGFFALFNRNNEPRAIFCHERVREWPIEGGQSTTCRSIYNPKLVDCGSKLLKSLGSYGVAMAEFKCNEDDNSLTLMEVNPRFWGSLSLAIFSGVDFPYLLFKMAMDGDVEPLMFYKTGVLMRFWQTDFLVAGQYLLSKKPAKVKYLLSFLKDLFNPNIHDGTLSRDDPKPGSVFKSVTGFIILLLKYIIRKIRH